MSQLRSLNYDPLLLPHWLAEFSVTTRWIVVKGGVPTYDLFTYGSAKTSILMTLWMERKNFH